MSRGYAEKLGLVQGVFHAEGVRRGDSCGGGLLKFVGEFEIRGQDGVIEVFGLND